MFRVITILLAEYFIAPRGMIFFSEDKEGDGGGLAVVVDKVH